MAFGGRAGAGVDVGGLAGWLAFVLHASPPGQPGVPHLHGILPESPLGSINASGLLAQ